MERNNRVDFIRCAMNYMIVVLHAWAAFQYVSWTTIEFKVWTFVCNHLCWMALPTFFMISGWLLFSDFTIRRCPEKIFRRLKRLLIPYVVWNLTFVAFYLTMARFVPRLSARVATFGLGTISGILSKVFSLTVSPIDGPLWFLRVLLLLSFLSPMLWWAMKLGKGMPLIICSVMWAVGEWSLGLTDTLRLTLPSYAIAPFVIGGVLAKNGKSIVVYFSSWRWFFIGLFACVIRGCAMMKFGAEGEKLLIAPLLAIIEAPALLTLVAHINTDCLVDSKAYRYLKNMSFFAYAGHFMICSIFLHTIAPHISFATGKFTVLIVIFVGCGISAMALIYGLGRRHFPKLIKFWDGTL